eukprot:COSAG06_NODE_443_length_15706_cov_348.207022_13_plen_192_part_00
MLHTAFSKMEPQLAWSPPEPDHVSARTLSMPLSSTAAEISANFSYGPLTTRADKTTLGSDPAGDTIGSSCLAKAFQLSTDAGETYSEAAAVHVAAGGLVATFPVHPDDPDGPSAAAGQAAWLLRYSGGGADCPLASAATKMPVPVFLVPVSHASSSSSAAAPVADSAASTTTPKKAAAVAVLPKAITPPPM